MLLKILGTIDVVVGVILIIFGLGFDMYNNILIFSGIVLMSKSLLGFVKDFASWIDFLAGLMIILCIWIAIPKIIIIILGVLILQKGLFSFI